MLRLLTLAGCGALGLIAQTPTTERNVTYTTDINGRRVEDTRVVTNRTDGSSTSAQYNRNINGGLAPLEKVQERVIREDASGRVVERIIQRYDQTGNPGPPEKSVTEERRSPGGSSSMVTTNYRGDVNGHFQVIERSTTESSKSGNTTNATTVVERPSLNGGLQPAEKKVAVATETPAGLQEDVTTLRKDPEGRFTTALREVTEETTRDGRKTVNTSQYEPGVTGRMELSGQVVTRSAKNPDGTEKREVDIYRQFPGRTDSPGRTTQLIEQQIIDQKKSADGVVESISVRRPSISEPDRLGQPHKIAERVCTGPCK